jgi:hypothetical protein
VRAWLKRFGLHLAAAVGATGVFVAAAAVGASQTRLQAAPPPATVVARPSRTATPPAVRPVRPERSLAGTVRDVQADAIEIVGVGGRTWRIEPAPGALIRLNGKSARLEALQPGDSVVILGQAQGGPGLRFLAHAITAKSH